MNNTIPIRHASPLGFVMAALLTAVGLPAQAQGTISSGTTFLQFVGTPFGTTAGNANLLFGSASAFGTENLYRLGWSYNQGAGTSNRPFSSLDTPTASYVGNVATFNWTNAGAGTSGFARWNATLVVTLTEIAPTPGGSVPGSARVDSRLTFTAAAANAGNVAYNIFHDIDLDIAGAGTDTYRVLDNAAVLGRATDGTSSTYGEFVGAGATRYEFNTGSALRTRVGATSGGTGTGNLATSAGASAADWASTDGAVAFQWSRTLAPGESTVIQSSFTINSPVPEPASAVLMLGGGALLLAARRRRQA
ncbi:MAG: PEP-CTERM sorting domain-containing protein [Betaproteobacteria bacterium]